MQTKSDLACLPRAYRPLVMSGRFRAAVGRIHSTRISPNDSFMKRVLYEGQLVSKPKKQLCVRFVLGEENGYGPFALKSVLAEAVVARLDDDCFCVAIIAEA